MVTSLTGCEKDYACSWLQNRTQEKDGGCEGSTQEPRTLALVRDSNYLNEENMVVSTSCIADMAKGRT
jgi:hypothetical protein